jgi:hypothetical protein
LRGRTYSIPATLSAQVLTSAVMEGNTIVAEMGSGGEVEVADVSSRAGSEPEGSSELKVVDLKGV